MTSTYELSGWTKEFSVNIKLFDVQHQRLVVLISRLEREMNDGGARERMYEILLDLVDYCNQHFATEEAVMKAYNFPLLDKHALLHTEFMETVRTFQVRCGAGEVAISAELLDQLRDWLDEHVLGTDKMYTEYLNNRGMF